MFLRQLRGELRKLFSRPRTYMGYGAFIILEILILVVFKFGRGQQTMQDLLERNGFDVGGFNSSLTVTYWVMGLSMFLLGSIYFALISGDIVAKEAEDGNLRLVLARPISRLRLLLLKYAAVSIYTVSFVLFVGVTGYLMAVAALGADGALFVWNFKMKVFAVFPDWNEGMTRLIWAALGIGLSMITLSSIGFMFSCFRIKPSAASILTLSILFIDLVLQEFPFFQPYQEWFVTWRMSCWVYLLEAEVSWPKIIESYAFLGGLNVTLFIIGLLAFQLRDFKT